MTNEKNHATIQLKLDTYSLSRKAALIYIIMSVRFYEHEEFLMFDQQKIFEELENFRIQNNIPVTELVKKLGIGRTTYYEWKNGKAPAKLTVYEKVEKFLQGE